jgi:hypothetical protein
MNPLPLSVMIAPHRPAAVLAAVLLLSACAAPAAGQACPEPAAVTAGVPGADVQPFAAVRYLADDALEGRLAGSDAERCAADYVAAEFARIGLRPAGPDGTFFQEVPLASAVNPHAPGGTGRNVIALLDGSDPALRDEAIVVGAHYDHLGHGGAFSLAPGERAIHNGADDNASGVGALLAIAETLARGPRPARSVVFVAFTGEEFGLLGSSHYAAHPAVPLERTRAMLNLDMVGRLEDDPLLVYGVETAAEWRAIVRAAADAAGVPVVKHGDGFGPSDHTSFYARDIPVLHFFTNVHEDYHRPSDVWERVDADGLRRVSALAAEIAREVADRRPPLTLQRGAGAPQQAGAGTGYGAYLGTIPDFSPVEHGVKLSGVGAGSPAERAGLRQGDVIVAMNETEIADLYAFTDALRERRPGDEVRVTVLRDGARLTVRAVLGSRARD